MAFTCRFMCLFPYHTSCFFILSFLWPLTLYQAGHWTRSKYTKNAAASYDGWITGGKKARIITELLICDQSLHKNTEMLRYKYLVFTCRFMCVFVSLSYILFVYSLISVVSHSRTSRPLNTFKVCSSFLSQGNSRGQSRIE